MLLFIYICILALNIVAILLPYHFLGKDMEKKTKGIFIVVETGIMYVLVQLVYWLSSLNIDSMLNSETAKNLITFTFVPVNAILIIPFLSSSYKNFKDGRLKFEPFRNRCILLTGVLFIILLIEFFYFKDIQNGILSILQLKQ